MKRVSNFNEKPLTTVTEENFSKTVEEEIVTENGRTKKILRTTIKHPDGRMEFKVDEEFIDKGIKIPDCGFGGSLKPNQHFNEEIFTSKKESSSFKNQPLKPFDNKFSSDSYGRNEYEKIVTEDGVTKKVMEKEVKNPDGSYSKIYEEEIVENQVYPVCGNFDSKF